jgi:hypothetical protein
MGSTRRIAEWALHVAAVCTLGNAAPGVVAAFRVVQNSRRTFCVRRGPHASAWMRLVARDYLDRQGVSARSVEVRCMQILLCAMPNGTP